MFETQPCGQSMQIDVKSNSNEMNLNQEKNDFESESENAEMSSISLNTFTNRRHINDNSRVKRETRALFVVTKKQKRNDDDTNDVFNVVDDFDAANEIEENVDDDELANNERDIDEIFDVVNDDEVVRRETNVDEDFFRDVFRDRDSDNALEKRKRS
jgi:hypothetical protein